MAVIVHGVKGHTFWKRLCWYPPLPIQKSVWVFGWCEEINLTNLQEKKGGESDWGLAGFGVCVCMILLLIGWGLGRSIFVVITEKVAPFPLPNFFFFGPRRCLVSFLIRVSELQPSSHPLKSPSFSHPWLSLRFFLR